MFILIKKNIMNTFKRGFTLVELVLGIAITSVILGLLVMFLRDTISVQQKQKTIRELDEQGSMIMETIISAVQSADSVTTPTTGSSGNELELAYTASSDDPTVFSLDTGVLSVERGGGGEVDLHNTHITVTDFTVDNRTQTDAWDTVSIILELSYNSPSNLYEYNYQKTWNTTAVVRLYERN